MSLLYLHIVTSLLLLIIYLIMKNDKDFYKKFYKGYLCCPEDDKKCIDWEKSCHKFFSGIKYILIYNIVGSIFLFIYKDLFEGIFTFLYFVSLILFVIYTIPVKKDGNLDF